LAVRINENRVAAAFIDSVYTSDEGGTVHGLVADADGVGLIGDTGVADINVAIAGGEIVARLKTQCDVVAAGCVATERFKTGGRIVVAVVVKERIITDGRVVDAVLGIVAEVAAVYEVGESAIARSRVTA
jgi:hypothetical protein